MIYKWYRKNVIKVDVSTPTHPASYMLIEKVDYTKLLKLGIGKICLLESRNTCYAKGWIKRKMVSIHRLLHPDSEMIAERMLFGAFSYTYTDAD